MSSNFDHGTGTKSPGKNTRASPRVSSARDVAAAQQPYSSFHPALVNLVRLLAREAAAAWLAGEEMGEPTQENPDGKTRQP